MSVKCILQGANQGGKSAYQSAVEGGYTGTEEDFNEILATGPWLPLAGGKLVTYPNSSISFTHNQEMGTEDYPVPSIEIKSKGAFEGTFKIDVAEDEAYINFDNGSIVINDMIFIGENGANIAAVASSPGSIVNKGYVDNLVGNIATVLDAINGEVI